MSKRFSRLEALFITDRHPFVKAKHNLVPSILLAFLPLTDGRHILLCIVLDKKNYPIEYPIDIELLSKCLQTLIGG